MKIFTAVAAAALLLSAVTQLEAQSTVRFGALYGYRPATFPTEVINGNGDQTGTSLEGVSLWFLCLDQVADDPSGTTRTYDLDNNSSSLSSGIWGSTIISASDRQSVVDGISNIFFNNQAAIYGDVDSTGFYNTPGSAMQYAAWALTNTYGTTWTGPLTEAKLDAIITAEPDLSGTLVEDYLYSSLISNPDSSGRVFFGNPAAPTPSDFQATMFFAPYAVPEPSLISVFSLIAIGVLTHRSRRC